MTYVYPLFYSMQVNDALRELKCYIQSIFIDMGADIIEITLKKANGISMLSLFIDKPGGITVGECTRLNKRLRRYIEEKELIPGTCSLEVSSPGLDRPFKEARDFKRLEGKVVDIWLSEPIDGQNLISGSIQYAGKDAVDILDTENRQFAIEYTKINKAKLKINEHMTYGAKKHKP